MDNEQQQYAATHLTGNKFLYQKPELLTVEAHGDLGFTPAERPHEYTREIKAVPLNMVEFSSAQRNYPIIFSELENPVPLAVVSVLDENNLFLGDDGHWDRASYLPSYLRCYPFTIVPQGDDKLAVVVDRSSAAVSENPKYPFFVDEKPSEYTDSLMNFCVAHERERLKTNEFCKQLKELELLAPYRSTHRSNDSADPLPLADYYSINVEKLNELPADTVHELHKSGRLVQIYMQLYSIEMFRSLMARRESRQA